MLVQLFFCVIQSVQELINTEVAVENCGYWSVVCVRCVDVSLRCSSSR